MKRKLKSTLSRVYFRVLSKALSIGFPEPFEWIDKIRFSHLIEENITPSAIREEKEKLLVKIRDSQQLHTEPKYLKINKTSMDSKTKLRIAILINANENKLLVDVFSDLKDSANAVGHICEIFTSSHEQLNDKSVGQENLLLEQFKPDLVIAEAHNDPTKFHASKNLNLLNLKTKLGFKIFLISIDLWRDFDVKFIKSWRSLYDALIHLDIQSIEEFKIEKDFWWPYFSHPTIKEDKNVARNEVLFSGNLRFPERRSWLYQSSKVAKQMNVKFKVEALDYTSAVWKSRNEYLKELNNVTACLNFSWKKPNFTLITFRTLDVISSGSALLQQEDPESMPLRDFLVPYLHYLPFFSKLELSAIFLLMKENPDLIEKIARTGSDFYNNRYSKPYLWSILENRFKFEAAYE